MTDHYCPLGPPPDGCLIRDGMGTCEAARGGAAAKGDVRFCRAAGASICARSFEHWVTAGRPRIGGTPEPSERLDAAPSSSAAQSRWADPAISTAPGSIEAWAIYALHERRDQSGPFYDDAQRSARDHAAAIAQRYTDHAWAAPNLVFLGEVGTGKTFLARIIGRIAGEAGLTVRFAVFRELLLRVKDSRSADSSTTEAEILRPYKDADLLILDDVRPVFGTQDDENIIDELLKARYGEDRGTERRPTIVTSNLCRSELAVVIGEAAMRRLYCDGDVEHQIFDWPAWLRPANGVAIGHWSEGPLCIFDVETTGVDLAEDRMVQASFVVLAHDDTPIASYTTLVHPGDRPVGDGALEAHGISTEKALAEGTDPKVVLGELTRRFSRARSRDYPVVIYNLPFDWGIYLSECERHGVEPADPAPYFLDPLLLDRHLDKYRRGKRTLEAAVAHYLGREIEGAHDAEADATATGQVMREILRRHPRLRSLGMAELQDLQREWYETWRRDFNAYQAGPKGKGHHNGERWPV